MCRKREELSPLTGQKSSKSTEIIVHAIKREANKHSQICNLFRHIIQHESLPKPINAWMTAASIEDGGLLRSISKSGKVNGDTLSDWAIWPVVEQSSKQIRIEHFGAHDLRRTCAKLCWKNGGDLEKIKFQLGDSSIQTTERYLVNSAPQEYEMERVECGGDIETSLSPWRVRCRLHTDLQILISKFTERTPNSWFFRFDMSGNGAGYIRSAQRAHSKGV
jgi:hypothetical protein